ncbi:MAG: EAL domain-containing protein [Nitrosomonas sp.]|nr:EAL domain-containing protein [Nitrosomonas sp.]
MSTSSATYTFIAKDEFELIQSATDYPLERTEDGWVSGHYYRCKLTSAFQPIIDPVQNKIIGHAAYIRSESNGEIALSPWQVFAQATNDEQLVSLDRLCRAIHALNYFRKANHLDKLFVGVHPRLLESVKTDHGRAFEDFLNLIGVRTSRVVIEIPSIINRDWELLKTIINNYRSRGYLIATNYSNSNHYWLLEPIGIYPDIVRIKVSDLINQPAIDAILRNAHHSGVSVLVWNIETFDELTAAKRAGADYLQGNFLGLPTRTIHSTSSNLTE